MSCPHGNPIGGCDTCDEVDAAFEAGKRSALAEQQEPVACFNVFRSTTGERNTRFLELKSLPDGEHYFYTSPQAQPAQSSKPWVGLTPNDIRGLCANTIPSTLDISLCRLVEKFLREKNNA